MLMTEMSGKSQSHGNADMALKTGAYAAEKAKYSKLMSHSTKDQSKRQHDMVTTPLFALNAKYLAEGTKRGSLLPQYGVLGFNAAEGKDVEEDEPIMLNTNAPNSAFICGVQGSGKSYTLATILENCLVPNGSLGKMGKQVAGVVFHYDKDSTLSVAEAAHLSSLGIKVEVLVSKSNEHNLQPAYMAALKNRSNVKLRPLALRSKDLSAGRMLKLMAFSEGDGRVPLYIEVIQRILRDMARASKKGEFNYADFSKKLNEASTKFTPDQKKPMAMRLLLLESFMVDNIHKSKDTSNLFNLKPGTLTIVDLTDEFLDAATACVLFDICLSLIKESAPPCGLVVALDEAHKYLNASAAATVFTDHLLTTIREQRHNSTRVIIATQEPTLSEKLLDLCSVSIIHRFSSPAWFKSIKNHLGGATSLMGDEEDSKEIMEEIVNLDTGESLVFSPSSYLCTDNGQAKKLGTGVVRMRTRLRIGDDGGNSKMAVDGVDGIMAGVASASLK